MKAMGELVVTLSVTLAATTAGAGTWTHRAVTDDMTGKVKRSSFSILSTNSVTFGFPYGGPHQAMLYVFIDGPLTPSKVCPACGSDGMSIMISTGGQVLHDSGGRISFDGTEPESISLSTAADRDPKAAFLEIFPNPNRILDAKTIKVDVPFFHDARRVFTFSALAPLSSTPAWKKSVGAEEKAEAARVAHKEADATAQRKQDIKSRLDEVCAPGARVDSNGQPLTSVHLQMMGIYTILSSTLNEEFVEVLTPYEGCLAEIASTESEQWNEATRLLAQLRTLKVQP